MRAPRLVTLLLLLAAVTAAAPALAARGKRRPSSSGPSVAERDISTTLDVIKLPNGGLLWGVQREGPTTTAALLVRGGSRHEDMDHSGTALAVARWVEESMSQEDLARAGVTLELSMLSGGALFTLRGPSSSVPGAMRWLLKAAMQPRRSEMAHGRDRAALEPARSDVLRVIPDLIGGACWTGSSFELPALGNGDTIGSLSDATEKLFHSTWYRPRNMTVIALGPGGARPYSAALAGTQRGRMARETLAPGEPGLPVHQVLRGGSPLTVAGASLPGPQQAAAALLLRARTQELLEDATQEGKLDSPWTVEIVWTRSAAIVYAALVHVGGEPAPEAQAAQLKILESALLAAAGTPDGELNELRKREGARLTRRFATPEGALELLAPLAAVSDEAVDLRKSVMGTPSEIVRAGLDRARSENHRLTIRRTSQAAP